MAISSVAAAKGLSRYIAKVGKKLQGAVNSLNTATQSTAVKISALGVVQGGVSSVQTQAKALGNPANLNNASNAASALQGVLTQVSTLNRNLKDLGTRGTDTELSGTLSSERNVVKESQKISDILDGTNLLGVSLSSVGVSKDEQGNYSLDTAAFNAAYTANPYGVVNLLASIGASIDTQASTQLGAGSATTKAYDAAVARQDNLGRAVPAAEAKLAAFKNNPYENAALELYRKVGRI